MDVIPLNNADSFFKFQDHTIFVRLESLTKKLVFNNFSYILKNRQYTYFIYVPYKALRAVDTFFFFQVFSNHLFLVKNLFFPRFIYLFTIFIIILTFFISSLTWLLQNKGDIFYWWYPLLLFCFFIQSGKSMYDPHWFRFILWHL